MIKIESYVFVLEVKGTHSLRNKMFLEHKMKKHKMFLEVWFVLVEHLDDKVLISDNSKTNPECELEFK